MTGRASALRLLAAGVLSLCACVSLAQAPNSTRALAAQADAIRAQLGTATESITEDRADFLRRQLLASLDRRQDMVRAIHDVERLSGQPARVAAPRSLLALDDLRREIQRLDADLDSGRRRMSLLEQERTVMATQLTEKVAAERTLLDARAEPDAIAMAKLETALTESVTAETDMMLRLLRVQQTFAQAQRDAIATALAASSTRDVTVTDRDAADVNARLRARGEALARQMAAATTQRARARAELARNGATATPLQLEAMKERVANADIDMELTREARTNLATEQLAWQTAVRIYRDRDESAIVEARRHGPMLVERLERRRDFLASMSDQILMRSGMLSTELAQNPGASDAADKRALRDVFDQRLQMVQRARFDESRLIDLIARMREDFDARASAYGFRERVNLAWAFVRDAVLRAWNFEVFTVNQTVEVDGRKTQVPRGVTVGKIVKAPLLLVLSLFLAAKLTSWWERWLHRRRGMDEGRARLLRRWALALLVAACVLASLAIAGIPLAAFAFIGGAVAIGIGFGMQALFKNLISGVLVLIERPFRLGDVIEVGTMRGMVVDIDLRTSVVRDADGADTLIPNSVLMEENVKNVTYRTRMQRQTLPVVVDGDSEPRAVIEAMRTAAQRHGQLVDDPEPTVLLEDFADNGLRFVLHYWIELVPGMDRRRVSSDLRMMILGAFEDAGIKMAPPPPIVR
ncbi:Mechanosensitive ion channel family protein [Lysobacter dokdonensis DS-58]|uniref:Mechanosensitive ion channel family protein n=1 Tax=Lysobacter dokdonensis DS-58 TaxID=1300345 RepID=A0A0A2WHN5_9GAMM|nr:mechanosensitive ion channel domain-containing protein [Lysobacter dokdonensis]KGQ19671.1 Mechanosensitive ion channel family protein [Lysobacter dokdonensis DS-58]